MKVLGVLDCIIYTEISRLYVNVVPSAKNYFLCRKSLTYYTIGCPSSFSLVFDFWRQQATYFHFPFFQDAKVMSWWDYGYQITAMANRTILVDNNTWNNTHISRVGQVK